MEKALVGGSCIGSSSWLFTANEGLTGGLLEDGGSSRSKEYRFGMNVMTWPWVELRYKRIYHKYHKEKGKKRIRAP